MGDSLAGRFFHFRLHPLSVKELLADDPDLDVDRSFAKLMRFGGFPEPYFAEDPNFLGQGWDSSCRSSRWREISSAAQRL